MTSAAPAVDPSMLRLAPAVAPDPASLAAITAAVQLAWPRPAPDDEHNPIHEAWRFSGRWWHKPVQVRRERPWARR
jgi:hypothetical protein